LILIFISAQNAYASFTWKGEPATLKEIEENVGGYFTDGNGNYKPYNGRLAEQLWEKGLFLGSDGCFNLDRPLTRAEGTVMVLRLLGRIGEVSEATDLVWEMTFADVPDWAQVYVAYAAKHGIVAGYSPEEFGSGDPMTAQQYITLTLRALGYRDNVDFTYEKALEKAVEISLIGGNCYEKYKYSNLFMRANAVQLAYTALYYVRNAGGELLSDVIRMPGRPEGNVPAETRP